MVLQLESALGGRCFLPCFDLGIDELNHMTAVKAHDVVVVVAIIELIHRTRGFIGAAAQNTGLLELGEHAVNRGYAHIKTVLDQGVVHFVGAHVAHGGLARQAMTLEKSQNMGPLGSNFEPSGANVVV